VKIITWNIAQRDEAWRFLANTDADIALLQEARQPPADVSSRFAVDTAPWYTAGIDSNRRWRTAVVKLSDRLHVDWLRTNTIELAVHDELAISCAGTLAAAMVTPPDEEPILIASMYAAWERPHQRTGSRWIYADGSAHRLISDLSALIGQQSKHRIIAAGDLNILYGYGEHGNQYWASRYATIFDRMAALGLKFVGPQAPNGRQAEPWPNELPASSRNVPTYHPSRQTPATATRQLDFVFASESLAEQIAVRALNAPEEWGPSDHCRVEIVVGKKQ